MVRYPMKKFGSNLVGSFDVAIPVVHGTNVEDGTLMGYLEMLGVPYAACDVTASALGMDKYLMKAAMKQAGLPVLDAMQFTGKAYALDSDGVMDQIEGKFSYPLIVKPVNLGSSVGISKAGDRAALRQALSQESYRAMEPEVLGPAPAPVVKLNNRYRYRITVVGQNEKPLRQLLAAYMKAFARRPEHRNMAVHTDCNLMD